MTRYYGNSPHSTMQHLNSNLLCAVDVETTGLIPREHDIIQIAILPLDNFIKPLKNIIPFCVEMKPKRIENIDAKSGAVHKMNIAKLIQRAIDPWSAVDLFEEWFEALKLPLNCKIIPLAHNFPFDREFIIDWIGLESYNHYFDGRYRDTMIVCNFLNERANFKASRVPFPKVNQPYVAGILDIDNSRSHDALQDCVMCAEIYRKLVSAIDADLV